MYTRTCDSCTASGLYTTCIVMYIIISQEDKDAADYAKAKENAELAEKLVMFICMLLSYMYPR